MSEERPDGVHTFRDMEEIALEWKRKYYDTLQKASDQSTDYTLFLNEVAKVLGIQTGRGRWWDNDREGQKKLIINRIKKVRNLKQP